MRRTALFLAVALAAAPLAAAAQTIEAPPGEESVFEGDWLTIGFGALYGPSYDGSDDYVISPAPLVQGSLGGVRISPRPAGLALDFVPDAEDGVGWMVVGFLAASRLPVWVSVTLAIAFELFTLAMIRDNLTLNVVMLVWPVDAIRAWQAG